MSFFTPANNFSFSNHLYSAYLAALLVLVCLSFGIFTKLDYNFTTWCMVWAIKQKAHKYGEDEEDAW